jgi:hypothetical protein
VGDQIRAVSQQGRPGPKQKLATFASVIGKTPTTGAVNLATFEMIFVFFNHLMAPKIPMHSCMPVPYICAAVSVAL